MNLVRISFIAEQWDVSTKTVRRFIAKHRIKLYPVGPRTVRVNPEDFNKVWAYAAREGSGESRSRSKGGDLARRLGPAKKRKASRQSTAEIVPFPGKDFHPSAA